VKVLSLLQPWASLWVAGAKRIETRGFGTKYRGRIAVAASKRFGIDEKHLCSTDRFAVALDEIGIKKLRDVPLGVILGWITLTDCREMVSAPFGADDLMGTFAVASSNPALTRNELAFGNYAPGRFAWLTSTERFILAEPIPFKGSLGLRDLPADIAARLAP
jgi:hypothetical protein